MFRKAETVGRLLDLRNLININREKSELLILSKVKWLYCGLWRFTGVLEIHNITKSVQQGKTIFYEENSMILLRLCFSLELHYFNSNGEQAQERKVKCILKCFKNKSMVRMPDKQTILLCCVFMLETKLQLNKTTHFKRYFPTGFILLPWFILYSFLFTFFFLI